MSGRAWGRLVVYTLLLLGLAAAGLVYQHRSVPARVERALRDLGHRHPAVASRAWEDLHQLYFTKWAAVELVVAAAQDPRPISFLVQEAPDFVHANAAPARRGFRPSARPWFYKSESIPCRTVGDAIRAMLYNESDVNGNPRWKRDWEGDWDAWWTANRGYYGG